MYSFFSVPPSHKATEVLSSRTYVITDVIPTETFVTSSSVQVFPATDVLPTPEPTLKPIRKPKPTKEPQPTEEFHNYAPMLKVEMKHIRVQVGDVLDYQIPEGTFTV